MLRQKPQRRLVLFGTETLTWMIFHDGFLECHIGPSPSVGGYVLSNLEPKDRRGHQFAILRSSESPLLRCRSSDRASFRQVSRIHRSTQLAASMDLTCFHRRKLRRTM